LYEEAEKIDRRALGNDHPHVATDLNNRAVLLKQMGRLEEAMPLYEEAEKIDRRTFGNDHPYVAIDLNNRAMLLRRMGKKEEANRLGLEALAIYERALGPDHPDTIQARRWLSEEEGGGKRVVEERP
jgi:tetratricopeptide (TPR) repeat protein